MKNDQSSEEMRRKAAVDLLKYGAGANDEPAGTASRPPKGLTAEDLDRLAVLHDGPDVDEDA